MRIGTVSWANADTTCQRLRALQACYPHRRLVFIWDNVRYHHAVAVRRCAQELGIELVYLPPYSPDLMLVERLWQWLRQQLTALHYVVIANHGLGLFPVFFGDMVKLAWPGQFNLDFMCMLALSGLWVAYRHRFRATGLLLGLCACIGGASFLSVYLLVESFRVRADVAALLLGENRPLR